MCDPSPCQFNIEPKMLSNPSCPSPCRKGSSSSIRGGGRRASRCCSQRSVRSSASLPVVDCMKDCAPPCPMPLPCCNQPRPDCCRIPCCPSPCLPRCPEGVYVEKVQSMRPDLRYEPPTFPFDGMSSYREHYFPKCGARTQSYRPQDQFDPSCAKMEGLSTYRDAYQPKPLLPYQKPPWSRVGQFEPSCAKMEGYTTYRYDYKGCMGERVTSLKPLSQFDPSGAKMEGLTTYRYNYIPYCSREYDYAKQPLAKKQTNPGFSCAPMEGVSTYRGDFWPKCCAKRRNMKPNDKARFSDAKMEGHTTYRNDYNPFHFEKCVGPCIPAIQYDQMNPPCGIFCCGGDPPVREILEDNCPPISNCCPPFMNRCGNEMGLFPDCPLPECCQMDPRPVTEAGDC